MGKNNIWHVIPVNDLVPHYEETTIAENGYTFCQCQCKPEHKQQGNGALIIVHNSFDGREGVEWANELLKSK